MKYVKTPDGTIAVNDRGYPLSEVPHGYDICQFNPKDLNSNRSNDTLTFCDVGYWDSRGKYHEPCRSRTFYDEDY